MTFYDHYKLAEPIRCLVCGEVLSDWEGFDGPCVFAKARQGVSGYELSDDWGGAPSDGPILVDPSTAHAAHPDEFEIYSSSCSCAYQIVVRCTSEDGVWKTFEMLTGSEDDRRQRSDERRGEYKARLKWLAGRTT